MFSPLGLFRDIRCPRLQDCSLPNCIFSHSQPASLPEVNDAAVPTKEYDPFSAGQLSPPPPKRRRLGSPTPGSQIEALLDVKLANSDTQTTQPSKGSNSLAEDGKGSRKRPQPQAVEQAKLAPNSISRTVSPPPIRAMKRTTPEIAKAQVKTESLTPRNVAKAPALLKTRLTVLQKLHEQMKTQNDRLAEAKGIEKSIPLTEQELVTLALDEEEAATKLDPAIYKNAMAQKILQFRKMTMQEWSVKISARTQAIERRDNSVTSPVDSLSTGLSSIDEQVAVLRHVRTSLEGLERFGYVTAKPTALELASAKAGVAAAAGFESCDRCSTRFQVFPGRDEQGRLTSHGKCRYHWARPNRMGPSKADRIRGQSETTYPCCNQPEGSEGCSEAETHVFSVKDPKRLGTILQFEHTPANKDTLQRQPLTFDCEMGYTTLGMEVIRVTAVSWPKGIPMLDVLVRPFGEILDLNTRFSGVTKEGYASAPPYDATISDPAQPTTSDESVPLRKVESPKRARELLFDLLSPETPLIGHAIDNDLNVCRIIHPFVIDTVLLYPHRRGLPFRYGLKMLARQHLSRGIQTGGEAGHDSKEDAVATGDLVTKRVGEKWKSMKHEGWVFMDGILRSPEEARSLAPATRQSML